MNFKESIRSHFTIFLFLGDLSESSEIKTVLGSSGYDTYFLTDQDTLTERVREGAPHMILFSVDAVMGAMSDFVQQILSMNSEIVLIPIANSDTADALIEYKSYNFYQFVSQGESLPSRCLWAADTVSWLLYLSYQNEQLYSQVQTKAQPTKLIETVGVEPLHLESRLKAYQPAQSKEDVISHFLRGLELKAPRIRAIFFRYLPTVHSLVPTQALGFNISELNGVGIRFTNEEGRNLSEFFANQNIPSALSEFMKEGMGVENFSNYPLFVNKALDGVFVIWSTTNQALTEDLTDELVLFSLLYQNTALVKRLEFVDDTDPVTDLYKREHYLTQLNEEVSRAQRLEKPVSVVKLMLDYYDEIGQSLGPSNRDLILRAIAKLIIKSSRINDISCRTQDNEISLILPHTDKKGAALRGERLRRMIENHSFAISGVRVSVSLGVSEFPALCSSAAELEMSASQAAEYIQQQGGNKVCLYRPAE